MPCHSRLKPGDTVRIKFCSSISYEKNEFYVNLLADDEAKHRFQRILNSFGSREEKVELKIEDLESKQICLSLYEEDWHRVIRLTSEKG